jgi:hypothetical protein
MLTSPGVILEFDWGMVHKQIDHNPQINFDNNIVYIGGYFKSALYNDVGEMLRELDDKNCIVFMDPGRFTWIDLFTIDPDVDVNEVIQIARQKALRENFHYVDIYSATDSEFRSMFMDIFHGLGRFNIVQALEHIQQLANLPKVMIIRDRQQEHVYIKLGNRIIHVKPYNSNRHSYIHSSSQFDARLIQYLSTEYQTLSNMPLTNFIEKGVHFALGNSD